MTVAMLLTTGAAMRTNTVAYEPPQEPVEKELNKEVITTADVSVCTTSDYYEEEEQIFDLSNYKVNHTLSAKTGELFVADKEFELVDERTTHYVLEDGYEITNCFIEEEKTTSWEEVSELAAELDEKYSNITLPVIYGIMRIESSFCSDAYSSAKCVGLMQLNPEYQQERMRRLGCTNLFNPEDNLRCGVDYLDTLIGQYGLELGVRIYGVGASNVDKDWAIAHMDGYLADLYEYMDYYKATYGY